MTYGFVCSKHVCSCLTLQIEECFHCFHPQTHIKNSCIYPNHNCLSGGVRKGQCDIRVHSCTLQLRFLVKTPQTVVNIFHPNPYFLYSKDVVLSIVQWPCIYLYTCKPLLSYFPWSSINICMYLYIYYITLKSREKRQRYGFPDIWLTEYVKICTRWRFRVWNGMQELRGRPVDKSNHSIYGLVVCSLLPTP